MSKEFFNIGDDTWQIGEVLAGSAAGVVVLLIVLFFTH